MITPQGPGQAFTVLFDESVDTGPGLPTAFQRIYGSDWRLRTPDARPYVFMNFAASRDGRVSFAEPGASSGGQVSQFNRHDQWLMGLLRARADAVLVGDTTLKVESDHLWTAEHIFPADAAAFATLRQAEGRAPLPLHVFLSLHGDLPPQAAVLQQADLQVLIATTRRGSARARGLTGCGAQLDIRDLGEDRVDLAALMRLLHEEYQVRTVLCEGGPRVYGSLLAAGQVDDEFLTLCPILMGSGREGRERPSLVEGVTFGPGSPARVRPVSLRRMGDYLFLRSHYLGTAAPDARGLQGPESVKCAKTASTAANSPMRPHDNSRE